MSHDAISQVDVLEENLMVTTSVEICIEGEVCQAVPQFFFDIASFFFMSSEIFPDCSTQANKNKLYVKKYVVHRMPIT